MFGEHLVDVSRLNSTISVIKLQLYIFIFIVSGDFGPFLIVSMLKIFLIVCKIGNKL